MHTTIFNTPIVTPVLSTLIGLTVKLFGWKIDCEKPCSPRYIMLSSPYSGTWSAILSMAIAFKLRSPIYWVGCSALFKNPITGTLVRYLGGVPDVDQVDDSHIAKAVTAFSCHSRLVLSLTPGKTSQPQNQWNTHFWNIANQAKLPVLPSYIDKSRKVAGLGAPYHITGNQSRDIANLQAFYANLQRKYPENAPSLTTNPLTRTS